MVPTTFSSRTHSDYTVVEGRRGKLITTPQGITYFPTGHLGSGEVSLDWAQAWELYKLLETLDQPQEPT
jgi:hypothetical protein